MMQEFLRYKITYTLSFVIVLFYLYSMITTGNAIDMHSRDLVAIGGVYAPFVVLQNEWWRILVSIFLHGGLTHVALNTISLIIVGRVVEEYFYTFNYLVIYFISGVIGVLASIYFHPLGVLIGASGAIFGVFGALVGFFIANRRVMMHQFKAVMQNIGVILLINLGIGLAFPSVDMVAHIAGLIFGVVAGFLASYSIKIFLGYITLSIIGIVAFAKYLPNIYVGYF